MAAGKDEEADEMNVSVFYDSGRVDEFDMDHFTHAEPFDGCNMLTNFELRFDDLGKESLWLQTHFYDVRPSYRDDTPPDETPVARRMRGWRFLLVDKSEMAHVAKIVVNGELVAWRQGDDLINGVRFHAAELLCYSDEATSSINRKAVALHDYLANARPDLAADEEALCQTFGFTSRAYEDATRAEERQPHTEEDAQEWMDEPEDGNGCVDEQGNGGDNDNEEGRLK